MSSGTLNSAVPIPVCVLVCLKDLCMVFNDTLVRTRPKVVSECQCCHCWFTDDDACQPVTIKPGGRTVHRLPGSSPPHRRRFLADGVGAARSSADDVDCGDGRPSCQVSPVLATVRSAAGLPQTPNCIVHQGTQNVHGNSPRFPAHKQWHSQLQRCYLINKQLSCRRQAARLCLSVVTVQYLEHIISLLLLVTSDLSMHTNKFCSVLFGIPVEWYKQDSVFAVNNVLRP